MTPQLTTLLRWLTGTLLLAALYAVSGKLGLLLAIPPGYASAIFPASGLALAALLLYGRRWVGGVWLGSFLLNSGADLALGNGPDPLALGLAAVIATGAALQALLGEFLIRRSVRLPTPLDNFPDIARFLLLGGPVSCLVNASVSVSALFLGGAVAADNLMFHWWTWWIGDSIGVMIVTPLIFIFLSPPREIWRNRLKSVAAPLALTFTVIVIVFIQTSRWELERIRTLFQERAHHVVQAIDESLRDQIEILDSIKRLFLSSESVTRGEFHRFIHPKLVEHPEIKALEWIPRVTDRQALVRQVRQRYPNFIITEYQGDQLVQAGEREVYYPVLYLEPMAGNEAAFGYDIASNPDRRAAMEYAVSQRRVAITPPLKLVQDLTRRDGLLILYPVMADAAAREGSGNQGFATSVLLIDQLLHDALNPGLPKQINVRFIDATRADAPAVLYEANPDEPGRHAILAASHAFELGGRQWRILVRAGQHYLNRYQAWQSWLVLAGGLIFTSLLTSFLLAQTGHTSRVQELVDRRTHELEQANRAIHANNRLLNAITLAQGSYITAADIGVIFADLLHDFLSLTDSRYGFIVELVRDEQKRLKMHPCCSLDLITSQRVMHAPRHFSEELPALFGEAASRRKAVIGTAPDLDLKRLHISNQSPRLHHFVLLPILHGDNLIGLAGLANRPSPYTYALAEHIEPLLRTCGNILSAVHTEEARIRSQQELRNSEDRLRSIINNAAEAIITLTAEGRIDSINPAGRRLLGLSVQVTGRIAFRDLFVDDQDRLLDPVFAHDDGEGADAVQFTRQMTVRRGDGQTLPVLLSLSRFRQNNRTLYTAILHDLTEQKRIEQMKNEFISTVSHELRTPLTSIRGSLGLIDSGAAGELPDQARNLIKIADRNARRLVTLINGILDMEKIESGTIRLEPRPTRLLPVVQQAVEGAEGYAEQFRVRLRLDAPEELDTLQLNIDADKLIEVLYNLLSNAIKYSPAGQQVTVTLALRDAFVRIGVHDKGPGIPEEFHDQVFAKFSQADTTTTRRHQGTGLGLSIARSLVEMMGGSIDFETRPGEGTTFYLEFPIHVV